VTHHVTWDRGISLVGHDLWLDPLVVKDRAFVSHAHSDHTRRHRQAVLTAQTMTLIPAGRRPRRAEALELGQPLAVGPATLTLHDAGHMVGSAQLLFAAAATPIPRADVLVIESTYGRPHFRFPDSDFVIGEIAAWCRRALDHGVTPVLLASALGKAQDLMLLLASFGFRFALEERCVPFAEGYRAVGVAMPDWVPLGERPEDRVVIAPPAGKEAIHRLDRYRTALVSGWAQEPSFWRRFGADYAFPLSNHCDFQELLDVVELAGAGQVYTVHGFTDDLARHLRRRGVRAHPLERTEQLTLAL
jgi:putative mRNA 3-end processing factor